MTITRHTVTRWVWILAAAGVLAAVSGPALPASAQQPAHVRLQPATSRVQYADGTFAVTVDASEIDHHGSIGYDDDADTTPDRFVPSDGLGAFEMTLNFNPGVLEVTDVRPGDFLGTSGRAAQCFQRSAGAGDKSMACVTIGNGAGPQGSGRLATFTFRPLANGNSYLILSASLSGPLGNPIDVVVDGGIVAISGAPANAPTPGPNDGSGGDGVTPIGGGDPTGSPDYQSDADGDGVPAALDPNDHDPTVPNAGTGYQPPDVTWPATSVGALAAMGLAVILGSAMTLRARRR